MSYRNIRTCFAGSSCVLLRTSPRLQWPKPSRGTEAGGTGLAVRYRCTPLLLTTDRIAACFPLPVISHLDFQQVPHTMIPTADLRT